MKKLIGVIIMLFVIHYITGQTKMYVDPTFTGVSDGTIDAPYNTFPQFIAGDIYLLKSGTTLTLNNTLIIEVDNVVISSYGEGVKPLIYNPEPTRRTITIRSNNILLKGISVKMPKAPSYNDGEWNIMLYNADNKNLSMTIDNCDIIGGNPAIHSFKSTKVEVLNSTVTKACYDACYGEYVNEWVFKNCTFSNMDIDPADLSQDLIHIKHAKNILIDNCILDHQFPGKYCIIAHQDDAGFDDTKMIVTNTKLIGSFENEACVKASVPYSEFKNCIFMNSMRTMQDVWDILIIDNCLIFSNNPNQIQGLPWNNYPSIKNSTFIGVNNPYLGQTDPVNTIFWNCSGGGDNWVNSVINPMFDENYNATGQLEGIGYVSTGTIIVPPVDPPVDPSDTIANLNAKIAALEEQIISIMQLVNDEKVLKEALQIQYDSIEPLVNIVKLNQKIADQKDLLQECYNVFQRATIPALLKLNMRNKIIPYIQ